MSKSRTATVAPGICVPWADKKLEYENILGDEELLKREWEYLDENVYMFIWYWVHR